MVRLALAVSFISAHGFVSALRGGRSDNGRDLNSNVQYYSIPSSGLCAVKDGSTPSWITEFYTDYAECCSKGWVEAKCLADAPPGAIATNTVTDSEYYYQAPTTGMCSPVDAHTPSYMTVADFFTSYTACCKKSWNEAACMAAKPELTPTVSPSLTATDAPSSSSGPSYQPSISIQPSAEPSSSASLSSTGSPTSNVTESLHIDPNATETHNDTTIADPTQFTSETNSTVSSDVNATEPAGTTTNATEPAVSTSEPSEINSTQAESNETSTTTTTTTTTTSVASNSSCVAALWHVSEDFKTCTNAFGYDPQWDTDMLRGTYLHESLHNCCAMFFYVHGKECEHEDICAVEEDATYDSCSAKWHPDHVNQDGCSNGEFPEEWLGKDSLFFGSAGDCCDSLFGGGKCVVYDECKDGSSTAVPPVHTDPPEPSTQAPDESIQPPCQSAKWHLSEDFRICTNSPSYPDFWDTPVLSPIYLLPTAVECCSKFFAGECTAVEDVCASSCKSGKWHPSPDYQGCTNSFDNYPVAWDSENLAPVYLHSTASSCCDKFFGGSIEVCSPRDVCATSTTSSVAPQTTAGVTETTSSEAETSSTVVSQSTTELASTESPTSEFACKSNRWHPDPTNSDGCSNSLTYPPEWEHAQGIWFDDSETCCKIFSRGQPCKVYKVCEEEELPPTTTSTPQPTTTEGPKDCISNTWYPDMINKDGCSNTLDVDEGLRGNPFFAFSTSEECCNSVLRDRECKIYQVCEEGDPTTTTTPPVSSCQSSKWHPDMIHADGCSNSIDNIVPEWDSKFFLNSPEACCAQFFPHGDCVVHKDCDDQAETAEKPPCQSTKWHPDMIHKNGCSNGLDNVSEDWDERFFLDSVEECCELFFKDKECIVHRDCDDQADSS